MKSNKNLTIEEIQRGKNPYLSSSGLVSRKARPLKFNRPGKFIESAEKQRQDERIKALQRSVEKSTLKMGLEMDIVKDLSMEIPKVEWWDSQFLPLGSYDSQPSMEFVKEEIQVPEIILNPLEIEAEPMKIMLTKKEQKKIRRQRRLAAHKEKQEQITLGLLPPEPQKLKMSNMMQILSTDAIQDPTKIEQQVREQVEGRLQKHLAANEERKLTDAQKAAKKRDRFNEDLSKGVHVAVFLLDNVDSRIEFRVQVNARQSFLSGCLVKNSKFLFVEGGEKGIKRYKRLILVRCKFGQLLWEGIAKRRRFDEFETEEFEDILDTREYMKERELLDFFNLIK